MQFLPIWIDSLPSLTSLSALLRAAPLTAAHRCGQQEHHKYDCYGDHDDDDSRAYGHRDHQRVAHSVLLPEEVLSRLTIPGGWQRS